MPLPYLSNTMRSIGSGAPKGISFGHEPHPTFFPHNVISIQCAHWRGDRRECPWCNPYPLRLIEPREPTVRKTECTPPVGARPHPTSFLRGHQGTISSPSACPESPPRFEPGPGQPPARACRPPPEAAARSPSDLPGKGWAPLHPAGTSLPRPRH